MRNASLVAMAVASTLAKLGGEFAGLRHLRAPRASALSRSARLLAGPLRGEGAFRIAAAAFAIACLASLALVKTGVAGSISFLLAVLGFASLVVGELAERRLFFRAEATRAMPGPG